MLPWRVGVCTIAILCTFVLGRDNPKNGGGAFKTRADEKPQSSSGVISQHNSHTLISSKQLNRNRDLKKSDSPGNCNTNQQDTNCSDLLEECIQCDLDEKCRYGANITITCKAKNAVECKGSKEFKRHMICQYCYQTPMWQQSCQNAMRGCNSVGTPRNYFQANCTVSPDVICLGSRWFSRNMYCKWKNGYRWSTTFMLSVTLGGFGADRFYLGRWQEGIGKLFSFGGLGVWTIIDIILVGVRYLGPADGSLYVD